ncbi:hypothetical protein [Mycolicibacterium fortuitum]|uniref:hypothetical protein n=1 Tax=Mycolicibacterium fortuitum TaxID=1766 RepID=UPI001CE16727|nr:hypothetical protein [Mycolicibacterium fortuitum]MCA4726882.1 hypothetical protein [Mycolicibacterium fortuitum]
MPNPAHKRYPVIDWQRAFDGAREEVDWLVPDFIARGQSYALVSTAKAGLDIRAALKCPDCNSAAAVIEVSPGCFRGVVQHDTTCPWYAALTRELTELIHQPDLFSEPDR